MYISILIDLLIKDIQREQRNTSNAVQLILQKLDTTQ